MSCPSAQRALPGKVVDIVLGPVSTQVTLEIAPRLQIVATITTDSAKSLNLTKGSQAYGIIKASSVMIGMD